MINGKTVEDPTLQDLLQAHKLEVLKAIACAAPGIIQTFDEATRTAVVQVSYKRQVQMADGLQIISTPLLLDVPIVTIQGGIFGLDCPIQPGDECLVNFGDADIDAWFQNGGQALPQSDRIHDLSDGMAIVGLNSLARPRNTSVDVATGEGGISDGQAKVAIKTGLITLQNGGASLLTIMLNFITLLETLTVQDDEGGAILPLTAASIAALEAFKAQFEALLY